jgi:hypothetical protein
VRRRAIIHVYSLISELMKKYILTTLLVFGLTLSTPLFSVQAHDGEDHSEDASREEVVSEEQLAKMQELITILTQLIAVMTEYRTTYPALAAPVAPPAPVPVEDAHTHDESMLDEDHEDAEEGNRLIIEVEPHFGKTHVHMRYTDKPEEMFFVDAAIADEDALIAAIVAKTDLSEDEIQPALKYVE